MGLKKRMGQATPAVRMQDRSTDEEARRLSNGSYRDEPGHQGDRVRPFEYPQVCLSANHVRWHSALRSSLVFGGFRPDRSFQPRLDLLANSHFPVSY